MASVAPLYNPEGRLNAEAPFLLSPKDYRVVDGDTLGILGPRNAEGQRETIARIRFRAIAAPEKGRTRDPGEDMLNGLFKEFNLSSRTAKKAGDISTDVLKEILKDHVVHVAPQGWDVHGRILADITRSAEPGRNFTTTNGQARSVETMMLERNAAERFFKHDERGRPLENPEPLPDEFPFDLERDKSPSRFLQNLPERPKGTRAVSPDDFVNSFLAQVSRSKEPAPEPEDEMEEEKAHPDTDTPSL